jgi:glycosyltransferase involved in cell wall biosynthesis
MAAMPQQTTDPGAGEYVGYVGRISSEKGLDSLIAAARALPDVPVRLAGDWSGMPELRDRAPANVSFVGFLGQDDLGDFYGNSRFVVLPSTCFEVFPLVLPEAMGHGLPAVVSRIGGLPEIVTDGETGLLFEPGDADDLASKIRLLWDDAQLCRRMGAAARDRAVREFSEDAFYGRLMGAYERAIQLNAADTARSKV